MQRRSVGDVHLERDLGGVRQVSDELDAQINEVHGCYDKWATGLVRLPGKLLASTGMSSGKIWTIKQLRFRDRVTRFRHEGTAIVVDEPEFEKNGEFDHKLPDGSSYPDGADWPSSYSDQVGGYNDDWDNSWQDKWEDHTVTVTPSSVTLNEANGYQATVTVVSNSGSLDHLWFDFSEEWYGISGLSAYSVSGQDSGVETTYVVSASEAQRNAVGYGTQNGTTTLKLLKGTYSGRTPRNRDVVEDVETTLSVTLDYPQPAYVGVTPSSSQEMGPYTTDTPENDTLVFSVYKTSGSGDLEWTASLAGSAPSWVSLSPSSGTGSGSVTLSVSSPSSGANVYDFNVVFSSGFNTVVVSVSIAVLGYVSRLSYEVKFWTSGYDIRDAPGGSICSGLKCTWPPEDAVAISAETWDDQYARGKTDQWRGYSFDTMTYVNQSIMDVRYSFYRVTVPDIGATNELEWAKYYLRFPYEGKYVDPPLPLPPLDPSTFVDIDEGDIWVPLSDVLSYSDWVASGRNTTTKRIVFVNDQPADMDINDPIEPPLSPLLDYYVFIKSQMDYSLGPYCCENHYFVTTIAGWFHYYGKIVWFYANDGEEDKDKRGALWYAG